MNARIDLTTRCKYLGTFEEGEALPPSAAPTAEVVKTRMMPEFVDEGTVKVPKDALRNFVVVFKDRPAASVRGHGLKQLPGGADGSGFCAVYSRQGEEEILGCKNPNVQIPNPNEIPISKSQ